jgi:hypothetical protein
MIKTAERNGRYGGNRRMTAPAYNRGRRTRYMVIIISFNNNMDRMFETGESTESASEALSHICSA